MKHFIFSIIAFAVSVAPAFSDSSAPTTNVNTGDTAGTYIPTPKKMAKEPDDPLYPISYDQCIQESKPVITRKDIYHDGWIDLNKNGKKDIYEDPTQPIEKRVNDLLSQMTLEEKTCQLATLYGYLRVCQDYLPTAKWKSYIWKDGIANMDEQLNGLGFGNNTKLPGYQFCWPPSSHTWALNEIQRFFIEDTRLGIPVDFTNEGVHGVENLKATDFPAQLALGQTWDRALIRKVGEIEGSEARALGYTNEYAPIMDVIRDPRWGRCEEDYGESPYLVSELAIQMVKGIQSQGVVSTMKHFAIYSNNKGAREGFSRTDPQCGPREAENIHLWPYDRVIRAANPLGVMCSYNDFDGVPIEGSHYFLTDILRKRMGFRGYVVSDSDAVEYLYYKHHTASSIKDAVRQAALAGLDVRTNFTPPETYIQPLRELVKEGKIPMSVLDDRVRDVLRVKFWEGTFDKPYRPLKTANDEVMTPANVAVAKQAALESVVLLKNENHLLPLDISKIKTIAVSGPNADDPSYAQGNYGPLETPIVTVLKGLQQKGANKFNVLYTKGCDLVDATWPKSEIFPQPLTANEKKEIQNAVDDAKKADIAIVVVGGSKRTCGENHSRTSIDLPGHQRDLVKAVQATGKPTIVIVISGRALSINWIAANCPAILQAFYPGMEGGDAIADLLFGDANPSGKLTVTIPKTVGQLEMNFPAKPASQTESKIASVTGLLWPFGYGLSYTQFKYSNLQITPETQKLNENVMVRCDITNSGNRAGTEIVQLYTHETTTDVTTYEKNLRGFERVELKPGETKTVNFTITPDDLKIWNVAMQRVLEPGEFQVMVGASSQDIRLKGKFTMTE